MRLGQGGGFDQGLPFKGFAAVDGDVEAVQRAGDGGADRGLARRAEAGAGLNRRKGGQKVGMGNFACRQRDDFIGFPSVKADLH